MTLHKPPACYPKHLKTQREGSQNELVDGSVEPPCVTTPLGLLQGAERKRKREKKTRSCKQVRSPACRLSGFNSTRAPYFWLLSFVVEGKSLALGPSVLLRSTCRIPSSAAAVAPADSHEKIGGQTSKIIHAWPLFPLSLLPPLLPEERIGVVWRSSCSQHLAPSAIGDEQRSLQHPQEAGQGAAESRVC